MNSGKKGPNHHSKQWQTERQPPSVCINITDNGNTQNTNNNITMTAEAATIRESKMNEPNATIYVSNIDWKIKKPILRRALHTLFSRHGKVSLSFFCME